MAQLPIGTGSPPLKWARREGRRVVDGEIDRVFGGLIGDRTNVRSFWEIVPDLIERVALLGDVEINRDGTCSR